MILTGKKIEVEYVDVAASDEAKQKMRDLSGNSKAIPPQIFNGDEYCGVSGWDVTATLERAGIRGCGSEELDRARASS